MSRLSPPGPGPVPSALDRARVPDHVAWVASGTAGWARRRAPSPAEVAAVADRVVGELVDGALELGIRWLTVHAPPAPGIDPAGAAVEGAVADALASWPRRLRGWAQDRGVVARVLGAGGVATTPGAPAAGAATPPSLVLTLAVGYSGRGEIVDAVRRLAAEGARAKEVDEAAIGRHLYDPAMPDPDLVVRSGGDRRISDLLLWEVAYSELVFLDDPWPETGRDHLFGAVVEFQRRDRRYGGLVDSGDRP